MFSVSIDPVNNSMAASGGEDDKAYVWRIQNGETLLECLGKLLRLAYGFSDLLAGFDSVTAKCI